MTKYPWHILVIALAGWINRQQQEVIEYLKEENRVLREKLGTKRVLRDTSQKRRLGTAACKVGRKLLAECTTFFSPETLLRWHRTLVACKYDGSGKRGPKAKKANEVRQLVLRMKEENLAWGYPGRMRWNSITSMLSPKAARRISTTSPQCLLKRIGLKERSRWPIIE